MEYTSKKNVTEADSAAAIGSGDMQVFATPAMIALMENAAMLAIAEQLNEGSTSVGVGIAATHSRATGIGSTVEAHAKVISHEGRKYCFEITASDAQGEIGRATHTRVVVNKEKFLLSLQKQ